ncbi:MAG: Rieske (2Fe-2S) protein [Bacteroidales bacterium]|nr:Rieske (2Fe-2S) protein [Bacteroidales bacterium]MCF8327640.1 Rieske (2Fe-2S) protein [Bacteroidales bacterium]
MKSEKYTYFVTFIILFLIIPFFTQCDKENEHNPIPNVHVNINLDISSTLYSDLNIIGNHAYITGGYRGIVVYRMSNDEFVAYDRACPYDHEDPEARVDVEDNGLTLIDSTCMSRFLLLDGSVVEGPAKRSLKNYRTNFDGNNLFIYN